MSAAAVRGRPPCLFLALALIAAVLRGTAVAAQVPAGVYMEPFPRRGGIRMPVDVAAMMAGGAPALGIPTMDAFFGQSRSAAREGVLSMLVLPALFADSPDPAVTSEELQRLMFDGPTTQGTLTEFYRAASRGRFEVRGAVAPWVRTNVTVLEAAGEREGHGWIGQRMADFVAEAIHLADETIDFGQFDNNGADGVPNSGDDDGWVDGLIVKFTEVSGACGGPGPWPHFGAAREAGDVVVTKDLRPSGPPIRVQVYITDSALDCTGTQPDGIEVIAHETGHLIGLPDLYRLVDGSEREDRAWTVGCFDLMAGGAWGCGTGAKVPGFGPTMFSPQMKWRMGWIDFEDVPVADMQEFVLEPAQTATTALRVPLSPGSLEQFIIEYRPATGFDRSLPASGVLVYHYDGFVNERPVPPAQPRPYWYHLVEADGDNALRRNEIEGGNRGAATDVFARNGDIAMLDDASIPSTRDHLGGSSTVTIHSIRVDGGVARVVLSAGTGLQVTGRDLPDSVAATASLNHTIGLAGGTPPYTATRVAGGMPQGVNVAIDGAALRITGTPTDLGTFAASWRIADATGRTTSESIRLKVGDLDLPPSLLMAGLAATPMLDNLTLTYLDRAGNRNGRFDVGDARAFMIRTGRIE